MVDEDDARVHVERIIDAMRLFKLEFETACLAVGIDKKHVELARNAATKAGLIVSKSIDEVKKRAVKRKFGDVCGNEREIGEILNFVMDNQSRLLLVTGKENSGKTATIDEVFKRCGIYHEDVIDLKAFLTSKPYITRMLIPIAFIFDASGQEKQILGLKSFKTMVEKPGANKVIVVCREIDESMVKHFDGHVEIRSPGFSDCVEFITAKQPELLEGTSHENLEKIFHESGSMLFGFIQALMSKDHSPDITKSDFDLAIKLCSDIYKEIDREKLRDDLRKHLKATEKDKSDSVFKVIPYFNFLEHYVVENTYNFLGNGTPAFFRTTSILSRLHANRHYMDIEDIIEYLAFSIPAIETRSNVILPYIHEYLVYAKTKKPFAKKKKQEGEE